MRNHVYCGTKTKVLLRNKLTSSRVIIDNGKLVSTETKDKHVATATQKRQIDQAKEQKDWGVASSPNQGVNFPFLNHTKTDSGILNWYRVIFLLTPCACSCGNFQCSASISL